MSPAALSWLASPLTAAIAVLSPVAKLDLVSADVTYAKGACSGASWSQ
jgi:hypothetical protein